MEMNEKQKSDADYILNYRGATNQKLKAIEELSELVIALSKNLMRSWDERIKEDVVGEIADVKIMMAQMEIIFGEENVNNIVDEKLQRELGRIASENSHTGKSPL